MKFNVNRFQYISYQKTRNPLIINAIVSSYISKFKKMIPSISYFWSGCASSMKRGLKILGIAFVDTTINEAVHLRAMQTNLINRENVNAMS